MVFAESHHFDEELDSDPLQSERGICIRTKVMRICNTDCKKRLEIFPSSAGMLLTKLSLTGNNLVIWLVTTRWGRKISSLGRYVFGSEISYNKAPPRLPGLAY